MELPDRIPKQASSLFVLDLNFCADPGTVVGDSEINAYNLGSFARLLNAREEPTDKVEALIFHSDNVDEKPFQLGLPGVLQLNSCSRAKGGLNKTTKIEVSL